MENIIEHQLILSCNKLHPTAIELDYIDSLILQIKDWEYLISTIIDRGIGPLFFKQITLLSNNALIPVGVKTKLQQVYYKTFSRNIILYEHFRKVTKLFSEQHIPVIALKGIYLSEWLYQDIGFRQMSDIDLLVKEEDGVKCISILSDLGYIPTDSGETELVKSQIEIIHYPPMVLNGVSVEIHIKLHGNSEKYQLPIDQLWRNAIPVNLNNISVYALSMYDMLIHLCIHLDKHFRGGHVQFTCFIDICNLLEEYSGSLDWNILIETCKKYNSETEVFRYIVLVNKFMNASVPTSIIENYRSLLIDKDEQLFFRYLSGYSNTGFKSFILIHILNLSKSKSFLDKFKYLRDIIFPPKAFMLQKYQIKNPSHFLFYYPYRYWIGVKGIFKLILNRKNHISNQ